eukprot:TRINITY_DN2898_c1_g1_i1.p1 TRINITY_DN2898_c1_g1~~TRINITY_DN2898_c1_g1_i1.p1  ORF type:complete len:319 (-),score=114.09 TRINITY_DN2898_c1_g1_i1:68-994(-)
MQGYHFEQEPKPVHSGKGKYRDTSTNPNPVNIMYDARVYKGSNAARLREEKKQQDMVSQTQKRTVKRQVEENVRPTVSTPPPVDGRMHMDVQTEQYLEELTDDVPKSEIFTQTDPFLDRPPSPKYVPQKRGIDTFTQILPDELFDFNAECQPILEVLIGKVLQQSLSEVLEEEELMNLKIQRDMFEQKRNAEYSEVQRLEEAEKRKYEERKRRQAQHEERIAMEQEIQAKLHAISFAEGLLQNVEDDVFTQLVEDGFFFDPIQNEIEAEYIPSILEKASALLKRKSETQNVVENMLKDVFRTASFIKA